jgi:putative ABC transport system permease protein
LWQNRFGGRPDVIGEKLILDDEPHTVIGILPGDFELAARERIYLPFTVWADRHASRNRADHEEIYVTARLKPGRSLEQGRAEMEAIAERFQVEYPDSNAGVGVRVERLRERRLRNYRTILWLLLGAVGFVLLIAGTNVANLLLARSTTRRRETAIASALGASRTRLVRQHLAEAVVLAVLGGASGLLFAYGGLRIIRAATPFHVPRLDEATLDTTVLGFALVVSVLTGILFGLKPALQATGVAAGDFLRAGSRASERRRPGGKLLVSEIALATVLLVGAGLLVRTIMELAEVEPGFRPANVLTFQMGLAGDRYTEESREPFYRALRERLVSLPGVRSASFGVAVPMFGPSWSSVFTVADQPVPSRGDIPGSFFNPVGVGYFETLGVPLVEGRVFDARDTRASRPVVVVNESLARRIWPRDSAIGKRLKQGWPESEDPRHPWREVVGVVGDCKQTGLDADVFSETYLPFSQRPWSRVYVVLRTATDPMSLARPAQEAVRSLDPDLPVYEVRTMEQVISSSLGPRRFTMWLLGIFACLAMLLSAVGIYGVFAYAVAQRTREMGLRLALGAQRLDVYRLVVKQAMALAGAGLVLGLGGAVALTRLMGGLLYGVTSTDSGVFFSAPLILAAVAFVACSIPALRAMQVDPLVCLRAE